MPDGIEKAIEKHSKTKIETLVGLIKELEGQIKDFRKENEHLKKMFQRQNELNKAMVDDGK